jgi:hypothetical protein
MAYITMSNWKTSKWSDDINKLAKTKFIPMILAVGAKNVQMVKTGRDTFCVISYYENEEMAIDAKEKIAVIRSQASSELPMTMVTAQEGNILASS